MRVLAGLALCAAVTFAQSAVTAPTGGVATGEWIITGGLTAMVLYFWRQDRADREAQRQRDQEAYRAIAEGYMDIVCKNTAALVTLHDTLDSRPCLLRQGGGEAGGDGSFRSPTPRG